jgi:hypothetical protein
MSSPSSMLEHVEPGEVTDSLAAYYLPAEEQAVVENGIASWHCHASNFVVVFSRLAAGQRLEVTGNEDEYFMIVANGGCPATVTAGDEQAHIAEDSVAIVPPGDSVVEATGDGYLWRVFSRDSHVYAERAAGALPVNGGAAVAPLVPWPEPVDGYRLRTYRIADHPNPATPTRIFRSRNLMVNLIPKREVLRPASKLTPHSHDDFEQASIVSVGEWVHHIRRPWGVDSTQWAADEHVRVPSPSVSVIRAQDVHTSQNVTEHAQIIDVFGPPRLDFSRKGLVINADEYPMPE